MMGVHRQIKLCWTGLDGPPAHPACVVTDDRAQAITCAGMPIDLSGLRPMQILPECKYTFPYMKNLVLLLGESPSTSAFLEAVATVLVGWMAIRTSDQSRDADMVAVCRH